MLLRKEINVLIAAYLLVAFELSFSITIRTPEGREVTVLQLTGDPYYTIGWAQYWINYYTLDATIIGNPTVAYNCHGYAWSKTEGQGDYFIQDNEELKFFNDSAYSNDGQSSYISASEAQATHGCYEPYSDHSVRIIKNNYPVSSVDTQTWVSKWNDGPLVRHAPREDYYAASYEAEYGSPVPVQFLKLKTSHSGTLTNYQKIWIGAGGITHTVSGNTTTQNSLTIKSGATVNLGTYYINCSGSGQINNQGSVNPNIQIKQSGTLKALYPTIQSAINASTTSQQVELYGSYLLNTNTSIPTSKTLILKSNASLTMSTYNITTSSGTITVEAGALLYKDVRLKQSGVIKGLYPTIQAGINACTSVQAVYLKAGDYTENISMTDYSYLKGAGKTQTDLYGTITFNNVDWGTLEDLRISQDINIQGGDAVLVGDVTAADIINIDNGVNHIIDNVTTSNDGYVDSYCSDPLLEDITSTNSRSIGIISYGSDLYILGGAYENKTYGAWFSLDVDADFEDVAFCTQSGQSEKDIYVSSGSSSADVIVGSNGTFSSCPPPFYGDVEIVSGSCVYCGRQYKQVAGNESEEAGLISLASETQTLSPSLAAYLQLKNDYYVLRNRLLAERRKNRFVSASDYASDYQNIINSALKLINDHPDSPQAGKALRIIAYSYRFLHQHENILPLAEEIQKSYPNLKAAALHVEIPYFLETGRYNEALQATDVMIALEQEAADKQAVLYRKGTIYQNYLKDEMEALNVFADLIHLDPESGAALAARDRMDKIEGKPKPQPPTESGDQSLQFSAVNYPNPANPGTTIKYTLPDAGRVSIKIYNVMGHEVADLVDAGMPAGSHIIRWDGGDKSGNPVASGLYFYRIQYDKRMLAKKFLLLR